MLSPVARMVDDAANWLGDRVSDKTQGEAFLRALVASSLADSGAEALIEARRVLAPQLHATAKSSGLAMPEGV